jgi:uncharacterized RDD family membrane protein YckC
MAAPRRIDIVETIETPENVFLAFRLAGPASRMTAYVLDLGIRIVGFFLIAQIMGFLSIAADISGLSMGVLLIGLFLIEWGYGTAFEGLCGGRTPGKMVFKLRVIKEGGYPIGFLDALLRNLLRAADALPIFYGVGLVAACLSAKMQRIGDLAAGTLVVREARPAFARGPIQLGKVEEIPASRLARPYRPSDRTLGTVETFLRRRRDLAPARAEEIARALAPALAAKMGYDGPVEEVSEEPTRFLLRFLKTFGPPEPDPPLEARPAPAPGQIRRGPRPARPAARIESRPPVDRMPGPPGGEEGNQ